MASRPEQVGVLFVLAVQLVLCNAATSAEESSHFGTNAQAFIELLAKGNFAAAEERFDTTMRAVLPEEKLRQAWKSLEGEAGTFRRQLRTRTTRQLGFDVVFATCQFEKAQLDVKVVFGPGDRIAGLFFVPTQTNANPYAPPAYIRTNLFQELELKFGQEGWLLPGTLTLPNGARGRCPAVVLVHGSGPLDRDESVGPNKPFRDLAWGLAGKGIAVFRYEKRTREHAAKFLPQPRITLKEETVDDAVRAVNFLRQRPEIAPGRIFVLGHSLGGLAAPRIGAAEAGVRGLIILAGSTRPLEDIILEQTKYILSVNGTSNSESETNLQQLKAEVEKVKKLGPADAAAPGLLLGAPNCYWLDLRNYDPVAAAKALPQPMLILQGGRDYQVTKADFEGWKAGLGGEKRVTFQFYPDLNHLFIAGIGKSTPAEYEHAGHVAEVVVNDIASWIGATTPAE